MTRSAGRMLLLVFALAPAADAQFLVEHRPLAPVALTPGGGRVLLHDWNGNGPLDAIVLRQGVRLFLDPLAGDPGPLAPPAVLAVAQESWAGQIGNLNGDSYPDLLVQESPTFQLFARLGQPGPTLGPKFVWATLDLDTTRFGDLNGDGRMDVVSLPTLQGSTGYAWLTQPDGTPGPRLTLVFPGLAGYGGVLADLDGDGCDDIVRGGDPYVTATMEVMLGSPTGLFPPAVLIQLAPTLMPGVGDYAPLAAADVNGDGYDDVVISSRGWGTSQPPLAIFFGSPNPPWLGGLSLLPDFPASSPTIPVVPVDLDVDGNLDLLVSPFSPPNSELRVLRGLGDGTFSPNTRSFFTTPGQFWFAADDLDRDGDPDLFLSSWGNPPVVGGYGVLRNDAIVRGGASGSAGMPTFALGTAIPGSTTFSFRLESAIPGSIAALFLAIGPPRFAALSGPVVDPEALVLPFAELGIVPTDASGRAIFPQPIPADPWILGATFTAQWGIVDPNGSFGTPLGGSLALSRGRTITVF